MSAAFTPGPWIARKDMRVTAGRFNVCPNVTAGGSSKGMADERHVAYANAQLIAAAPELLETLKDLLAMCERQRDFNDDRDGEMFDRANAAIAKATGSAA